MRTLLTLGLSAVLLVTPAVGITQTVDELVDQMIRADNAGLNDIDNYVLKTNSMGMSTFQYFEKESSLTLDNGETVYIMRNVMPNEIQQRHSGGGGLSDASPAELEQAAQTIEQAGRDMEAGMQQEMSKAGMPAGIGTMVMSPPDDQPWLSANPSDMTGMYATMLRATADGKRQEAARDPQAEQQRLRDSIAQMKSQSRIVGRETVNGREAIILEADDISPPETSGGQTMDINRARIWVDAEKSVPLRMKIEGVMHENGQSRDITIEREEQDYRAVPGCNGMYEPFKSIMRLSGAMSPEDQAQLQEGQAEMAELQKTLAEMPAEQRDMIMRNMGPQMKMMENLSAGNGIVIETSITEIRCNTGLPDPIEIAQTTFGGPAAGMGNFAPAASSGSATVAIPESGTSSPAPGQAAAMPAANNAALQTAQQECLQQKVAEAQAAQKKKRGFGRLLGAVTKTAQQFGNFGVGETVNDIYTANSTAEDYAAAAKDLGLTEDEVAACQNPQ